MKRVYRDLLPPMRRAIRSALAGTSGREEALVWNLFKVGLPQLEQVLRPTYGGALSMNGVFCHGHPRAHFTNRAGQDVRPEAGDLLVVVHHLLTKRRRLRRALLLQLKMIDRHSFSQPQIELYADWPPFEFVYKRAKRRAKRYVRGGEDRGAQFAFIHRNSGDIAIEQGPVRPNAAADWEQLLATELLAMLTTPQVGGREFTAKYKAAADSTGWSPVVWDLLQTTFSADTYRGYDRVLDRGGLLLMLSAEMPQLIVGARWRANAEQLWALAIDRFPPLEQPPELDDDLAPIDGPISTIVLEVDWSRLEH